MKSFFDPVIDQIVYLLRDQISLVERGRRRVKVNYDLEVSTILFTVADHPDCVSDRRLW
jgi:hypothetical protein